MLLFLAILKAICELIGLSYLAMLVVGVFSWAKRHGNPIYRFFDLIASPMTKFARLITPKAVSDGHTRVVGAFLAALIWMVCVFEMAQTCRQTPNDPQCVKRLEGKRP